MKKKRIFITLSALFLLITIAVSQDIVGKATYYADRFHGRTTSNGQRYHTDSLTCAHLTYPFGTYLKVKNPRNGKEVVVRVNDRGPYNRHAVIDLSRAAARRIGIIQSGIAKVEITKVDAPVYDEIPIEFPDFKTESANDQRLYAVQEWDNKTKTEGRLEANAAPWRNHTPAATDSVKRWRILPEQMTAKSNTPGLINKSYTAPTK